MRILHNFLFLLLKNENTQFRVFLFLTKMLFPTIFLYKIHQIFRHSPLLNYILDETYLILNKEKKAIITSECDYHL